MYMIITFIIIIINFMVYYIILLTLLEYGYKRDFFVCVCFFSLLLTNKFEQQHQQFFFNLTTSKKTQLNSKKKFFFILFIFSSIQKTIFKIQLHYIKNSSHVNPFACLILSLSLLPNPHYPLKSRLLCIAAYILYICYHYQYTITINISTGILHTYKILRVYINI